MKVGDLVKFNPDVITTGFEVTKDHIGIVIHSEEVNPQECQDPTCKYFVKVKWAGIEDTFFGGWYAYHDIDLQVVAGVNDEK
jgi:hypothetical protein